MKMKNVVRALLLTLAILIITKTAHSTGSPRPVNIQLPPPPPHNNPVSQQTILAFLPPQLHKWLDFNRQNYCPRSHHTQDTQQPPTSKPPTHVQQKRNIFLLDDETALDSVMFQLPVDDDKEFIDEQLSFLHRFIQKQNEENLQFFAQIPIKKSGQSPFEHHIPDYFQK